VGLSRWKGVKVSGNFENGKKLKEARGKNYQGFAGMGSKVDLQWGQTQRPSP